MLRTYVDANTEFIAEVPTARGTESFQHVQQSHTAFRVVAEKPYATLTKQEMRQQLLTTCTKMKIIFKQAHELRRRKATQIIVWVASTKDRLSKEKCLDAIPVATAYAGSSLPVKIMRKMELKVLHALEERGIKVIAKCKDGQFANTVLYDADDLPLSRHGLQKSVWSQISSLNKRNQIKLIKDISGIDQLDLQSLSQMFPERGTEISRGNLKVSNV